GTNGRYLPNGMRLGVTGGGAMSLPRRASARVRKLRTSWPFRAQEARRARVRRRSPLHKEEAQVQLRHAPRLPGNRPPVNVPRGGCLGLLAASQARPIPRAEGAGVASVRPERGLQ